MNIPMGALFSQDLDDITSEANVTRSLPYVSGHQSFSRAQLFKIVNNMLKLHTYYTHKRYHFLLKKFLTIFQQKMLPQMIL